MSQLHEHHSTQKIVLQAITKPFNYAIVDEVDSLLIDSCRDPLLISAASSENLDRFGVAKEVTFCTRCITFCNTVTQTVSTLFTIFPLKLYVTASVHRVPPVTTLYVTPC